MNKISIALCTFNGERFLQEQLDSLAAQTRLPDEVVVGDDGSTDRTLEILEAWAKTVPFPVKIFKNTKNLGYTRNFEKCLNSCSGDILFPCDQDDVWFPTKIERMVSVFTSSSKTGLVYCQAGSVDENNQKLGFLRSRIGQYEIFKAMLFWKNPDWKKHRNMVGCCCALRKNVWQKIIPISNGLTYDQFIYCRGGSVTEVRSLNVALQNYRFHGTNVSVPGSWKKHYEETRRYALKYYQWSTGDWFLWESDIQEFIKLLHNDEDSPSKQKYLCYFKENQKHYTNRSRIQRNAVLFCPLCFWELLTGRYFQRYQPVRSFIYDIMSGIRNAIMLRQTLREVRQIFQKFTQKKT